MEGDGFSEWYEREHPRLISTLAIVSGHLDEAVDATDEAFARALDRWGSVSQMASPTGWTYQVALNRLRRQMRRAELERRALGRRQSRATVPLPDPDVWDAVRSLPLRRRTAVVLRYVADLTEAEIATAMGISRGTVAATLSTARKSLAIALHDPDMEEVTRGRA